MLRAAMFCTVMVICVAGMAEAEDELGRGINSATGGFRSKCVSFDPPAQAPSIADEADDARFERATRFAAESHGRLAGRSYEYSYSAIENIEELRRSLEISANGAVRGVWGTASAAVSFTKDIEVNKYDLFMVLRARLYGEPVRIDAKRDDAAFKVGRRTLKPGEILAKCGDEFVSSVRYGGSVTGFLVIQTRSEKERQRLRTALSGKFTAGVEVDVSAQQSIERVLRNNAYSVTAFQEGGDGSIRLPKEVGIAGFYSWLAKFENEIKRRPVVVGIETSPLRSVYPELRVESAATQREIIRRLTDISADAETRRRAWTFVGRHIKRFKGADQVKAGMQIEEHGNFVRELGYLGEACFREEPGCVREQLDTLTKQWSAMKRMPLPVEDPIYGVFDMASYDPTPTSFSYSRPGWREWWTWRAELGDLEITSDNSSLTQYFTCKRSGFCYNGGGGDDCQTADPHPSWPGKVTATLRMEGERIRVSDVKSDSAAPSGYLIGGCELLLKQTIALKDGGIIGSATE